MGDLVIDREGRVSKVVSVIVPIYNVEPYLRSCLDSVVAQARNCTLDAVLVDDGSTDASASIAEEYVERHPYMRLIRKRNGGLGQARNAGAAEARGDYLVFLDSDDIVPDGTYAAMTSALAAAPVDFVTGGVVRLKGQATIVSGAHQKSHPADSSATHIREHRGLLWDTTAWNKMFRREFWESHHLTFPEGVLYEDMELMTRSHLLAKQVAVLKRTSYLWRIRTEWPPSITQCRTDLQNIDDRFTAIFALFDTLQQRGTPELLEEYEHKILSMDMPIYVRHYGKNDTQQYRDRLESYVRRALQQCATGAIDRTTSVDRLKYWLIAHDRAAEVAGINSCQDTHFDTCPLDVHEGRVLRAYPTLDAARAALPTSLVDVTSELSPHTTVYEIASDGRDLRMDVHAFVPGLSPETSRAMVRRFFAAQRQVRPLYRAGRYTVEHARADGDATDSALRWRLVEGHAATAGRCVREPGRRRGIVNLGRMGRVRIGWSHVERPRTQARRRVHGSRPVRRDAWRSCSRVPLRG